MTDAALLEVKGLKVHLQKASDSVELVSGIDFDLAPGKTLCLVGESGSGKSLTALSLLQLLSPPLVASADRLTYDGQSILAFDEKALMRLRGAGIGMIFQEPATALNPLYTVGAQVAEAVRAHHPDWSAARHKARAVECLEKVGVPEVSRRYGQFPHQLSGGLRQRVMIAMALAASPRLLIADEPTTALDVTIQAQILKLLKQLQKDLGLALLLITHDLGVVAEMADEVIVFYKGQIVERASRDLLFRQPTHPYTRALLAAMPGNVPGLSARRVVDTPNLVRIEGLTKKFGETQVLKGIHLEIARGEALGLVGESGSGKSTLGRCLLRLIEPTGGKVFVDGTDLTGLSRSALIPWRKKLQIIFQDPYASLNPKLSIGDTLREPLRVHRVCGKGEETRQVEELLEAVGLPASSRQKYPHEFSGGQRQRIAIARALAVKPEFIVCDEPVSALDVSIQAQIIALLKDLRERYQLTYLFISHDLRVVRDLCDRVAVMKSGEIVEQGETEKIYTTPTHPYTQTLLASIPTITNAN